VYNLEFSVSVTPAAGGHHFVVLFQNDVLIIVKVQQTDGIEFVGHAAGRVDIGADLKSVDDALDGGVIRRLLVLPQWERTDALAVVGVVALRRYDPPGPPDLLEVDVHFLALAGPFAASRVSVILVRGGGRAPRALLLLL